MKFDKATEASIRSAYSINKGSLTGIAKQLNVARSTAYDWLKCLGLTKPLVTGSLSGVTEIKMPLPATGQVKRYVVTSAQNNTKVNDAVWTNLQALATYHNAQILVGTYSYNKNNFGKLAVKRGTKGPRDNELWYDPRLEPFFSDKRLRLAKSLVWCGEMNILPTAEDPLSGLETYSHRKSAIFPHAKMSMRSIAAHMGEGTKFNYTTGTVTERNYIQKKAGLKGEHHHIYGGLLVEVDSNGNWWVRQLDADETGTIYDLDIKVSEGLITSGHRVEAITWGDIHATTIDPSVCETALGRLGISETLKPKYQFLHDVLEGVSINPHGAKNCHDRFKAFSRGFLRVENELECSARVIGAFERKRTTTIIVDSNHDGAWLEKWLQDNDYRYDPTNAWFFLKLQLAKYSSIRHNIIDFNILNTAFNSLSEKPNFSDKVVFLNADESFTICKGQIECGDHGHKGPNGAHGTPQNLNKVGRKANTGHTHSAGIYNGLYVAGTSSTLKMSYNSGSSSWSHSHIVTYANGKRTIITIWAGKWRA